MKFAAITIGVGIVGVLLASSLQGRATIAGTGVNSEMVVIDPEITGSVAPLQAAGDKNPNGAVRLIDLKTGASCKTVMPPEDGAMSSAPLGPDCAKSPSLARIAYWGSTPSGTLVMADAGGHKVLEFAPGDGVMFESVYPPNELITIVPAKS
ncbi:hypothetical protein [Aureimonas psammosilenae]|uniref:hypothetical protein n=1 Tax=Aureimonas psammosilenae TaxID=2495496 RepID=UPI001260DC40|nr:hypothetical protein [Aureimonas psammosilenae]